MNLLRTALAAVLFPLIALAQEAPAPSTGITPVLAAEVAWNDLMYVKRPIVVFADNPNDPNFIRQMELLSRDRGQLDARDVILIVDSDPAARSEVRQKLRPRGFSLVLLDKDLRPVIRKPLPWDLREITNAIDKFPLRRQEIQQGGGRAAGG